MRDNRVEPFGLLPGAEMRERGELRYYAPPRRGIYRASLSRLSTHASCSRPAWISNQSQADSTIDAPNGNGGNLPKEKNQSSRRCEAEVPLSARRFRDHTAKSSMEYRHHLHSVVERFFIPGSCHRLAQPICSLVGIVQYFGCRLLSSGIDKSAASASSFRLMPRKLVAQASRL